MADLMSRLRVNVFTWGMEEPTIGAMVELAQLAEELGYEAIHVPWHYTLPTTGSFRDFGTRYLVDPTVLMPILARETRRVEGPTAEWEANPERAPASPGGSPIARRGLPPTPCSGEARR